MTHQGSGGAAARPPPSGLPTTLLVPGFAGVVGYAAIAQGAFYGQDAVIAAAVLMVLAVLGAGVRAFSGMGFVAWGFGLLAAGLLTSAAANDWPSEALLPAAGLVAAVGAFAIVRSLALRGERVEVLEIVAWTAAAIGLVGFVGVAFHLDDLALEATGLRRASSTLTYANATAALLVLAIPAAVLLRTSVATRFVAFAILTGLAATVSRGGALALIVLVVMVAALGSWRAWRPLARPLLGATMATAGLLPSIAGDAGHPVPAIAALVVGAAVAAAPTTRRTGPRGSSRIAVGAVIAVGIGAIGIVAVTSGAELGRVVGARFGAPEAEGRLANWSRTFDAALQDPWFGTGPGSFRGEASRAAHNEYLQTFSETGLVGLASVIGAMGLFAAQLGAARWRSDRWAFAAAACVAFAVHSAVDFLWRFPLLLIVAFAWLALGVTGLGTGPEHPFEAEDPNPLP